MPKTLADGRIRVTVMTLKPANPRKPTVAELAAGKVISRKIMKSDYKLGATGDAEITETELCNKGAGKAFGETSYEGSVTPFRYLDPTTGKPITQEDDAWALLKTKGTELWFAEREGPDHDDADAEGQEVDVYHVVTSTPQKPSSREGYIKRTVQLGVLAAYEGSTIGA